jgi:ribonuclease P protein component
VLARANRGEYARLGLAISRKCARQATARNHIKRLVRESFRAAQHELPAVDLVVMCRPVVNDMTRDELTAALQRHWQCVKKRCKKP